jgi:hypothetical protein
MTVHWRPLRPRRPRPGRKPAWGGSRGRRGPASATSLQTKVGTRVHSCRALTVPLSPHCGSVRPYRKLTRPVHPHRQRARPTALPPRPPNPNPNHSGHWGRTGVMSITSGSTCKGGGGASRATKRVGDPLPSGDQQGRVSGAGMDDDRMGCSLTHPHPHLHTLTPAPGACTSTTLSRSSPPCRL